MAKHEKKGAGLTERLVSTPETPAELIAALKRWSDSLPAALPGDWSCDARNRHNAERCRAILATVGLADDGKCGVDYTPLRERGLAENSAQWIAALWLAEYNALMRSRERFAAGDATPKNLARMLMAAEDMGRLQERLWWRAGVDPESGEKREALALTGRPVKRGQKDAAAKTNRIHVALRERRFARLAELMPALSLQSAAYQCESEGLGGAVAIVRQWNRHKEK